MTLQRRSVMERLRLRSRNHFRRVRRNGMFCRQPLNSMKAVEIDLNFRRVDNECVQDSDCSKGGCGSELCIPKQVAKTMGRLRSTPLFCNFEILRLSGGEMSVDVEGRHDYPTLNLARLRTWWWFFSSMMRGHYDKDFLLYTVTFGILDPNRRK